MEIKIEADKVAIESEAGRQEETNPRIKKTRHVAYSKLARATSWSRNSKLHLSD